MKQTKYQNFLIFACAFLWIIMMGSKNVYTAEIVELQQIFDAGKADIALAMTYYFITYSIAQIIMFFFMDRINIKWFLGLSMFLSGIVTVLVALITQLWQAWWLLSLNGILQAGGWGMCLAVLKRYLPESRLAFANTVMNVGMAIAGIISYGSSAFAVAIDKWNLPFVVLGIILSISAVLFFVAVYLCEKHVKLNVFDIKAPSPEEKPILLLKTKRSKAIFFISSFILSFFVHYVFYSGMNWMPDMLAENHNLESHICILISTLAPIATIVGAVVSIIHCEKHKNFIFVALVYLGIGVALSMMLIFLFKLNVIVAIVILVSYLVIFQGVITITFGVLPLKIGGGINSGGLGCLMNAAGGFAAGFAPMITGLTIEKISWQFSYIVIFIITALLFVTIFLINLKLSKNRR